MNDVSFWVWVLLAFGAAAAWGLTVVVNKRTLQYVDPFALNLIMRVPTIALIASPPPSSRSRTPGTWGSG